jgi:dihydrodipicolinate synthase/N-acetylneuraminate lyase
MKVKWSGVFPATTTQFTRDERLDIAATQKVVAARPRLS